MKKEEKIEPPIIDHSKEAKMRQIIIETDGNNISLIKAEVSGKIELIGVLQGLIGYLNQPQK